MAEMAAISVHRRGSIDAFVHHRRSLPFLTPLNATSHRSSAVIIKVFSLLLKAFPKDSPKPLSQAIGLLLPLIAGVWIVPLGVCGGVAQVAGII